MRDNNTGVTSSGKDKGASPIGKDGTRKKEVAYDEETFFNSYYKSSIRDEINDRTTIGNDFSLIESRFHYNATENSIIKALANCESVPHGAMVLAAEASLRRRKRRLLDLGSGTGHWVDFFQETYLVQDVHCVEISEPMVKFLSEKYANDDNIKIIPQDIASNDFTLNTIGGEVDYISAIGVMFHIVDDNRWQDVLKKMSLFLKPTGILVVGGDFGTETKNVQFNKVDDFENWREYAKTQSDDSEIRVNKRVRSLADWQVAATTAGLKILDLVRTPQTDGIRTPENDILILKRNDS